MIHPRDARIVQHPPINVVHHINKLKNKNHMIILVNTEKTFYKIQHTFMVKTGHNVDIEEIYFNIKKTIFDKPTPTIILNGENLIAFPLR